MSRETYVSPSTPAESWEIQTIIISVDILQLSSWALLHRRDLRRNFPGISPGLSLSVDYSASPPPRFSLLILALVFLWHNGSTAIQVWLLSAKRSKIIATTGMKASFTTLLILTVWVVAHMV